MRLTLALLTSVMLASASSAQSISPELQARGSVAAYAPVVAVAPEIATAAPSAAQRIDRSDLDAAAVSTAALPSPAQAPAAQDAAPRTETAPIVEKLQPVRKARVATPRAEPQKPVERKEVRAAYRAAPAAGGTRDVGRFLPPVF